MARSVPGRTLVCGVGGRRTEQENVEQSLSNLMRKKGSHLLDGFHGALGGRQIICQDVLMDVQGCQSKGHVRLEFGGEPLLCHIVAALHEQIVQGVQVVLGQGGGRRWHEGDAEQATQFMSTGPGGDLRGKQGGKSLDKFIIVRGGQQLLGQALSQSLCLPARH